MKKIPPFIVLTLLAFMLVVSCKKSEAPSPKKVDNIDTTNTDSLKNNNAMLIVTTIWTSPDTCSIFHQSTLSNFPTDTLNAPEGMVQYGKKIYWVSHGDSVAHVDTFVVKLNSEFSYKNVYFSSVIPNNIYKCEQLDQNVKNQKPYDVQVFTVYPLDTIRFTCKLWRGMYYK